MTLPVRRRDYTSLYIWRKYARICRKFRFFRPTEMHLSPYATRNKKIFSKQPFCLFTPCALLSNKCFKQMFKTFVLDIRLNGTKTSHRPRRFASPPARTARPQGGASQKNSTPAVLRSKTRHRGFRCATRRGGLRCASTDKSREIWTLHAVRH